MRTLFPSEPPQTGTPSLVIGTGILGACAAALCIRFGDLSALSGAVLLLLACGGPMWWLELRRFPVTLVSRQVPSWRLRLRLLGLLSVLLLFFGVVAFVRWSLHTLGFADALGDMTLVLTGAGAIWMLWMVQRPVTQRCLDSVELLGQATDRLLRRRRRPLALHRQTFLGWLVKAYFLPLMLGGCYSFVHAAKLPASGASVWLSAFATAFYFLYAVDTAFGSLGYCSTSGRINAHIRSTDSTVLGWIVTLVCYPPFNLVVLHQWIAYKDGYEWDDWLAGHPILLVVWGTLILLLTAGYVWSTVSFGLRFSNLSYRGLVSSGPYRYFKHPSYLFKNISWWLISIPFISNTDCVAAVANCLGLLTINGIYALRARTEERHLADDRDYRAYSAWMAEYSVLARCRRAFCVRMLARQ